MGKRPKFEPDLEQVEELAGQGLTQLQICEALGIHEGTLYRHKRKNAEFAAALKRGQAIGVSRVTNALFSAAIAGNVTAMIFYLKNRDSANWLEAERVTADASRAVVNVTLESE